MTARLTIRARLTIVYGGLFLAGGLLLLAVTYLLVLQQRPGSGSQTTITGGPSVGATAPPEQSIVHQATDAVRHDTLLAVATQGGIALAAVTVLAIGSGWLIAGRLLQPLHRITDTARRIADAPAADRGLHERIALGGPEDEVRRLADTFDLMLARLDHAFDGQRQFIANASHELRTPLTVNRALLEVALRRKSATTETRQLAETLLDVTGRHEKLIDGLLLLTRSEAEVLEPSYVDLADVVDHVVSATPAEPVDVRAEPGEAPVLGNPVLLERLVQNLVENGIRHNVPAGGWVRVTSGTCPDGTVTAHYASRPWTRRHRLSPIRGNRTACPLPAGPPLFTVLSGGPEGCP